MKGKIERSEGEGESEGEKISGRGRGRTTRWKKRRKKKEGKIGKREVVRGGKMTRMEGKIERSEDEGNN